MVNWLLAYLTIVVMVCGNFKIMQNQSFMYQCMGLLQKKIQSFTYYKT